MATPQQQQQLIALTTMMFNAPPGATYLAEFEGYLDQGLSLEQVAMNLANTDAFNAQFDGMDTDKEKIDLVLSAVGIDEQSDAYAEAFTHFQVSLDAGISPGAALQQAADFLTTTEDEAFSQPAATFRHKVEAGVTHSIELGLSSENLDELKAAVAGVTDDPATLAQKEQQLEEQAQPEPPPEEEQPEDNGGGGGVGAATFFVQENAGVVTFNGTASGTINVTTEGSNTVFTRADIQRQVPTANITEVVLGEGDVFTGTYADIGSTINITDGPNAATVNVSGVTAGVDLTNITVETLKATVAGSELLGSSPVTLNGGEGSNTLTLTLEKETALSAYSFTNVSNFQTLVLQGPEDYLFDSGDQDSLNLSSTDFTALTLGAPIQWNGTFTLTGSSALDTINVDAALTDTDSNGVVKLEGFATSLTLEANAQIGAEGSPLAIDFGDIRNPTIDASSDVYLSVTGTQLEVGALALKGTGNIHLGELKGEGISTTGAALQGDLFVKDGVGDSYIVSGIGNDTIVSLAGNDRISVSIGDNTIDLTAENSGSDTISYLVEQINLGANDTIIGFRAAVADGTGSELDAQEDKMDFGDVGGQAELANSISSIVFTENGQVDQQTVEGSTKAENTVDMKINFSSGGSLTFVDYIAKGQDLSSLNGTEESIGTSDGDTVTVTGVNSTDLDLLFGSASLTF